ncbi:MAG: response regulator transcription factor [Bacteroidota bacterium]|nr:response regulator transcription factor [Bacteroidota bacterium]
MKIKIVIADDHKLFREGLINLLSESEDIEIIDEAENGEDVIQKASKWQPDIILMDVSMPIKNGVEATRIISREMNRIKVIALSMHSEYYYVNEMLEAGAKGYIFKNCTYNELTTAIKSVYQGEKYLSADIKDVLIEGYLDKDADTFKNEANLTERELEVLKLYAQGEKTKSISEKLFVSVKTIGTHKQHILSKLNLKTTSDMTRYAIKNKLIDL